MNTTFKITSILIGLVFLGLIGWKNLGFIENGASDSVTENTDGSARELFWEHMKTAEEYRLESNHVGAKTSYQKALEINDKHSGALYYLGNIHFFLREYEEAEQNWQSIIKKDSLVARAWLQLGKLYVCKDTENRFYHPSEAKRYFKKAAELNREDTGPPLQLAKIAIIEQDFKTAEQYLEGVVAQNFRSYEGMFLKGFVNWKMSREESATHELKRAIEIFTSANEMKMPGEGATKSGSNPLLDDEGICDFFGDEIQKQLSEVRDGKADLIFEKFDEQVVQWIEFF